MAFLGIGGKKIKKNSSVIRKSKTKGYVEISSTYLMQEYDWIKKNTTLNDSLGGSPTVIMVLVDNK